MNREDEVFLNWDRETDILSTVRAGVNLDSLINVDSDRLPGIVKRIDPMSHECVGLIIHGFSARFAGYVDCDEQHLKSLMDVSIHLTNERNSVQTNHKVAC